MFYTHFIMDNKRTDEEEHALLMSLSGDTNQK
jgi:hypothetical protein